MGEGSEYVQTFQESQKRKRTTMNNQITEVKISEITISNRHREEMGDIEELAESIEENGLLQAIGITPDNELIFGERRLRAYRDVMKRETIPARVIEVDNVLHARIAEDVMRKDYTLTERVAIVESLCTFTHGGNRRSTQNGNSEDETVVLDEACKRAGLSKDSYYRAKEVEENGIPELVEQMDKGEIAVSAAAALSKSPVDEQEECMKRGFDGGKLTIKSVKKKLQKIKNRKKREADEGREVESPKEGRIQIRHCSFQELEQVAGIEPESVQLVCTDIPYGNDFVDQVEELAEFANRVLVDGGTFVSYLGQHRLNEKLAMLDKHLTYCWMGTTAWEGKGSPIRPLNMIAKSIPWVVYSKGKFQESAKWLDTFVNSPRQKEWHPWQRPLNEVEELVRYFSDKNDVVVDPCGGGFTTAIACLNKGRRFIGCDIDKVAVVKGQERLAKELKGDATWPSGLIPLGTHQVALAG
jgi:site-specific DNA-methyltransferase (adenine-specific)